jgi:hypothetical protein
MPNQEQTKLSNWSDPLLHFDETVQKLLEQIPLLVFHWDEAQTETVAKRFPFLVDRLAFQSLAQNAAP